MPVGNNYAQLGTGWPFVDTYTSYGGPLDMWGTTWNHLEVNDPQFGALIQANVLSGTAFVDHMRITIYTTNILPVELVDFFANREGAAVKCTWITASEKNNSHFIVERSTDAITFEEVGRVEGMGNSTNLKVYEFDDLNSLSGLSYYRLKQVDFDGEFEYSDIRTVEGLNEQEISVYPNPASNWANVSGCEYCESISIVSSKGQVIDHQEGVFFDEEYSFNLRNEADGIYYVVIHFNNGETSVSRLAKQSK